MLREALVTLNQRWAAAKTRHGERLDALNQHIGEAGV
jgi:hypothetical protein